MYTQYIKEASGIIRFSGPVEQSNKLSAGIYQASMDNFGNILLTPFVPQTDGIIELPNSPAEDINKKVDDFLSQEIRESFNRYDMLYKRGLLMYGAPGTGKTCIIHLIMKTAVTKDMIILLGVRPQMVASIISHIRKIEGTERPAMVVWEEFEDWVDGHEGDLLNLLDGAEQLNNVFYVATTNYIDQIPSRIRNRPSRFAEVIEIGPPDARLRRAFIEAKIHPEDKIDINQWVNATKGFSIDHIKDLIISVLVLKLPFDEAISKLNKLNEDDDRYNEYNYKIRDHEKLFFQSAGSVGIGSSTPEEQLCIPEDEVDDFEGMYK